MIDEKNLEDLSLRTYYVPEKSDLVIQLNISEMCQNDYADVLQDLSDINELHDDNNKITELCNRSINLLDILNNFTTNVSFEYHN